MKKKINPDKYYQELLDDTNKLNKVVNRYIKKWGAATAYGVLKNILNNLKESEVL